MSRVFMESDLDTIQGMNYAILTESGIRLSNGDIITEGKIVEIARVCEKLLVDGDRDGFNAYLLGTNFDDDNDDWGGEVLKDLSIAEHNLLIFGTRISGGKFFEKTHPRRIFDILDHFEDER